MATDDIAGSTVAGSPLPGPASPWPLVLAIATLALHVATNSGYNFFRDEFYYIACGRHLAWGYVDQPPLVAVLAAMSRALFGHSLGGLRFLPGLAGALTVWLAGKMARELGGGAYAQALAALCVMVAPVYLEGFTLFTMNAFDFLFWTILCWLLIRILRGGDARLWLAFGLVAGVGLLNKTSVLFLLGGVFLGLLVTSQRRQLARGWPWAGAALTLALFAPHIVWQIRHGWPTLEFMRAAQTGKNAHLSPLAFLMGQALIHHPFTAPIWIAGLVSLLASRRIAALRPLGLAYVFIFALFVVSGAKLYYLSPMVPLLFAAGAVAFAGATAQRLRWARPVAAGLLVAGGAVIVPVVLPVLAPATLEAYMHALHVKPPLMERHREPRLSQTFADEFGWEEMVARVARVYHALPPDEQAKCGIFASNYGEAGAIDFYGPRYGLPPAASGHNNYWLWGPTPGRGAIIITVGESEEDVSKTYHDVRVVDRTGNEWCMPYENDLPIIVGRIPKAALEDIWPRCKKFI